MPITIGILKEVFPDEQRVALDPTVVSKLTKSGIKVVMQKGAGKSAHFLDEFYNDTILLDSADAVINQADVIVKVQPPTLEEVAKLKERQLYIGFINPYRNAEVVNALASANVTSLAMELIPRISRAQTMDALSSQAGISGYKCAIKAAELAPGYFPMLTTAAGTIRPAKVVVIGAGVAGLQAIATAKRLGAIVEAYDIRPDAKEQVESLGAKIIDTGVNATGEGGYARALTEAEITQQAIVLAQHITVANAVITTAALPGRPAPLIVTKEMVENMLPGSVLVDMAADTGGNCELTEAGKTIVTNNGVTIDGPSNIASQSPIHASEMYAKNLLNLLNIMLVENELKPNWEDDILSGACLTRDGEIKHAHIKSVLGA